jgi:hypothetical protein
MREENSRGEQAGVGLVEPKLLRTMPAMGACFV